MPFNLIAWLFTDPETAGTTNPKTGAFQVEMFHFYVIWIIFCSLGILISFYFAVEGRKRFVKNSPVIRDMFSRYLGWLAVICVIGFPLMFARAVLFQYFFAWRFWRYLWLVSLLVWAILWVVYLIRKFPKDREEYLLRKNNKKYMPSPAKNNRRKAKAASAR